MFIRDKKIKKWLLLCACAAAPLWAAAPAGQEDSPLYRAPEVLVDKAAMDELMHSAGRTWQGASPCIERTKNGRLFACLFSGGDNEPDTRNYAVYMMSDDEGKTWIDPLALVDHPDEKTRITDPSVWIDPLGRLWFYWNQHYPVKGIKGWPHHRYGIWAIRIDNPDAPLPELRKQIATAKPVRQFDGVRINKPIILSTGEWLQPLSHVQHRGMHIIVSTDQGNTWTLRGGIVHPGGILEPMVLEKKDGTLWALVRLGSTQNNVDDGGVGQSFSTDRGKTWSPIEDHLPHPLIGVHSRLYFGRLNSGALIFVTNDSNRLRRNLTAFLSEDEGKTWPYSLMLDARDGLGAIDGSKYMSGPSYPDLVQAPDGRIFLGWDFGRYNEKEMRLSIFTEEDIKAGSFVSPQARDKLIISRLSDYLDIREVKTTLPKTLVLKSGEELEKLLSSLPTQVAIVDEKGRSLKLSGKWEAKALVPNSPGQYRPVNPLRPGKAVIDFMQDAPLTHLDTFHKLRIPLEVQE